MSTHLHGEPLTDLTRHSVSPTDPRGPRFRPRLRDRSGVATLTAVSASAAWGIAAGVWTPRGPLTSIEAIMSIIISLGVGGVAGVLVRTRWAMLMAPAVFAAAFELTRLPADGPMVDGIHASFYGTIALITGRGFHALVALVPMALGAAVCAATARSRTDVPPSTSRRTTRAIGRTGAGLVALALAALTVGLARPATTAPITGPDGEPIPGSVAELTTVNLGGHELTVMIRGASTDNPVLLFLAGGPGGSEFGAMRRHLSSLEDHFTVVTWDQRGAGTSYDELDPVDGVTLQSYVSDTIALTNYLRSRFDVPDIYLLGQSWGTTLGVLAVQDKPELFRAFVGAGQMVSQRETDRIVYDDTLAWAIRHGKDDLARQLEQAGPPPYESMFPYETALSHETDVYPYDHSGNSEGAGQMSENLLVEEYTLIDQVHILGAFMDTFAALYPQLQDIDFRQTATSLEVPMYFVQGAHEAHGRAQPFREWYTMLDAPAKDLTIFARSGHRPLWEQPDEFVDYMVDTVLARNGQS